MNFLDSHCHLQDERIIQQIPGILSRARQARLRYMVTCSTMEKNFRAAHDLARDHRSVLPCFGIHPWFLESLTPGWDKRLGEWLGKYPAGIGETGLDFMDRGADQDLQVDVFKIHLAMAGDFGRPINIHVRKAWDCLVHLLKKHGPLKAGGLIHSYSGSPDLVKVLEKYNLYISFSGTVTRPNAKKVISSLAAASPGRVVFETDSPDLFPSLDHRAVKEKDLLNEPRFLPIIIETAAKRLGMGFEELANHGYTNSLKLFEPILKKVM